MVSKFTRTEKLVRRGIGICLESKTISLLLFFLLLQLDKLHRRKIRTSPCPILVGPWTSEIGNELLYWIPYLEKLKSENILQSNNTYIVSRGGNSSWYRNISQNYWNFFEKISLKEYQSALKERYLEKRLYIDGFDQRLIDEAASHFGLSNYRVLHPMKMNRLFTPVWRGGLSDKFLAKRLLFKRFAPEKHEIDNKRINQKDTEYVAMKFWYSNNFPETRENKEFIKRLISHLSRKYTILWLKLPESPDGHTQSLSTGSDRIIDCSSMISFAQNLKLQTALIHRAKFFVGIAGGFTMLPLFYGMTSYGFHSKPFTTAHMGMARKMWETLSPGGYQIRDTRTFDLNELP